MLKETMYSMFCPTFPLQAFPVCKMKSENLLLFFYHHYLTNYLEKQLNQESSPSNTKASFPLSGTVRFSLVF